jgi:hypothetical protein
MMTQKYIQIIGNIVVRNLSQRYPALEIRFFAGKRGDMMRVYIVGRDDDRQRTGRLFDVEPNPGLETLRVKDLARRIETRIQAAVSDYAAMKFNQQKSKT